MIFEIERPNKEKRLPEVLTENEILLLLNSTKNLKHKTILSLLYSGGLRVGELIGMRIQDIVWDKDFMFIRDLGITFKKIFYEIIKKKNKNKWNSKDKDVQYLKRGRYVEFNLIYDRGTKFGLETGGNLEAIFMSLPPTAKWK